MTGQEIRRADELLTELVELVETARSVPISGSCVIPREHTLDLLDDLREVLPPEIADARRIVAQRDELLTSANADAQAQLAAAAAQAQAQVAAAAADAHERTAAAEQHAADVITQARTEAIRVVDEGAAENARLISSAGVHQAAVLAAEQLTREAEEHAAAVRASADGYATRMRLDAEQAAHTLQTNAADYAEQTLAGLIDTLQRSSATAERGRSELAARQVPSIGADGSAAPAMTEPPLTT